jgi:hypothetical protein
MQGRGTVQPGGDRAADYLATRFHKLGLKPRGDNGSYLQKIDFREERLAPETAFSLDVEELNNEVWRRRVSNP